MDKKSKKITFSSLLTEDVTKEHKDIAKRAGLFKIDDTLYRVEKTEAKKTSSRGYPDKFLVARSAACSILADQGQVWLYFDSFISWFKTSPVISCTKHKGYYEVETQNSIYRLTKIED